MPARFKISVVICTYNREIFLPGLMDSVLKQTADKDSFEILFIDNNSTDNTRSICQGFMESFLRHHIRYIQEKQQGLSFARNRGIQEAAGEYITFADDDALLTPDFLEKSCSYLDSHPETAEVGGPIFLQYMGKVPSWENPYMNGMFGYFNPSTKAYRMTVRNRNYPRGSNMTFRTAVFAECGGFNTSLGRVKRILMGGEEKDMAFRILDHGGKIDYSPDIVVRHLVPESRTTKTFIREQALGTGRSERIRSKADGTYGRRMAAELFKWGASLVLWTGYMLTLKPEKANMLLFFRRQITKGLLKG